MVLVVGRNEVGYDAKGGKEEGVGGREEERVEGRRDGNLWEIELKWGEVVGGESGGFCARILLIIRGGEDGAGGKEEGGNEDIGGGEE